MSLVNEVWGFHNGSALKKICLQCRRCGIDPLGQEDPLEKEMATHFIILALRIPRTKEPDRLQSMGITKEPDITYWLNKNNKEIMY